MGNDILLKQLIDILEARDLAVNTLGVTTLQIKDVEALTNQDMTLKGATGKDVKITLTDAAGARKVIIYDSAAEPVVEIDSNGQITADGGFVGALTGNVTGNVAGIETLTAKASKDLTILADGDEDVIIKMGDAAGVNKVIFQDSAGTEQASLDSDGKLTAKQMLAPLKYAAVETSGAPTNAECVSAFGAAATVGAGFIGVLQDSAAEGVSYLCVSNGTNYDVFTGAAAV